MLRFSANVSVLFPDLPLVDRVAAARDAGFEAIEIQFPYDVPAGQLARAAAEAGVKVVLINAPIDGSDATPGIASRPELSDRFRDSVTRARDYAEALGVDRVNILAGPAGEGDAGRAQLIESLSGAAEALGKSGIRVLLEPLNARDQPAYIVQTPGAAIEIIERCASDNLFLQFDVYHAAMMGLDPVAEFKAALPLIGHIQFADAPGRQEPGTGAVDFPAFFKAVRESPYDGWLGAEFRPSHDDVIASIVRLAGVG